MEHLVLCHRSFAPGWIVMSSDGRPWKGGLVSGEAPLATTVDEALALLAQNPGADFSFSTRSAHEVKAAPFDVQSDLASVGHDLAGAAITIMIPNGDGRWRLLQRADGDGFHHIDTVSVAETQEFLRSPEDAEAIERGLAGPIEVWLRRRWDAEAVSRPPLVTTICGNVVPLVPRPRSRQSTAGVR